MNTNIHLQLRQSQNLVLTPQMQQSIKLLSLSSVEVMDFVQQIVLENPFLEQEGVEESFSGLSVPQDERAQQNPPDQWQQYWHEFRASKRKAVDSNLSFEERIAVPIALKDHLRAQLYQHTQDREHLFVGDYLIDLVQEDGYIRQEMGMVAHDIARDSDLVLTVLKMLQGFDPVGVCARHLGECLLIQCRDQNKLTDLSQRILENLPELFERGPEVFAKRHKLSVSTLKDILDEIKSLNPKPGYAFGVQESIHYINPDVIVTQHKTGEWICQLNEVAYPRVMIDQHSYLSLMKGKNSHQMTAQDRNYIHTHISNANGLLKNLQMRALTILKVSQAIIELQEESLILGRAALKPMTLKEIAHQLELHESTVSRAVTGKYIAMPFGIIELKEFFGSGRGGEKEPQGDIIQWKELEGTFQRNVSNKAVQYEIKSMLEEENKKDPLSDEAIVCRLKEKGIAVARRTVAKYREELNIPSSFERKKLSKILTF